MPHNKDDDAATDHTDDNVLLEKVVQKRITLAGRGSLVRTGGGNAAAASYLAERRQERSAEIQHPSSSRDNDERPEDDEGGGGDDILDVILKKRSVVQHAAGSNRQHTNVTTCPRPQQGEESCNSSSRSHYTLLSEEKNYSDLKGALESPTTADDETDAKALDTDGTPEIGAIPFFSDHRGSGDEESGTSSSDGSRRGGEGGRGELPVAVAISRNIPLAVMFDPDAKAAAALLSPLQQQKRRRFRLYALLAFVVCAAAVILIAVGVTTTSVTTGDVPTSIRESIGIEARVTRVVGSDVLKDPASPYSRALEWITFDDPMRLSPDDAPNFIQRYVAAYFYFAMTEDGPWKSCNPPPGDDDARRGELAPCVMSQTTAYGVTYTPSYSWLSNVTECGWAGLYCDYHGQIYSLGLSANNLSGKAFPEGIYYWPFLQHVSLTRGKLRGPLPVHLTTKLKHLVGINFASNTFSGTIPDEWLSTAGSGRNLQLLDLGDNTLAGTLSSEIGNLRDMKFLSLRNNMLAGSLPTELGLMSSLSYFDVSHNRIEGTIPSTLRSWKHAQEIRLGSNRLVGPVPRFIGNELTSLKALFLDRNPAMTGTLPESLYRLTDLLVLDLRDCGFISTISSRIGNLWGLQDLRLSNNALTGTIPLELSLLTDLKTLWLQGNALTGTIPATVCSSSLYDEGGAAGEYKADCAPDDGTTGIANLVCDCCTLCCKPGGIDCLPT